MYDAESGEISSPFFIKLDSTRVYCTYAIKVPKGRRITVEIIKGKSLIRSCERNVVPRARLYEQLNVNTNNYLILNI